MQAEQYTPVWTRIEPLIRAKLVAIAGLVVANGGFDPVEPPTQAGDEEFRLDAVLRRDGDLVGALEFTLYDGDVHGAEGFGIGLGLFGAEAEVLAGWYPNRYTDEAFTWDVDRIVGLIEHEFSEDDVALAVLDSLKDLAARHH